MPRRTDVLCHRPELNELRGKSSRGSAEVLQLKYQCQKPDLGPSLTMRVDLEGLEDILRVSRMDGF